MLDDQLVANLAIRDIHPFLFIFIEHIHRTLRGSKRLADFILTKPQRAMELACITGAQSVIGCTGKYACFVTVCRRDEVSD